MNSLGQYRAVLRGNSRAITTHSPPDIHVCLWSFPPGIAPAHGYLLVVVNRHDQSKQPPVSFMVLIKSLKAKNHKFHHLRHLDNIGHFWDTWISRSGDSFCVDMTVPCTWLVYQTLTGERKTGNWPEFCDSCIDIYCTYKSVNLK